MADTPSDKQSKEDNSDDDMEQKDEAQVIDRSTPELNTGESEKEIVPVQDESTKKSQEKTDLEAPQDHSSLANLVAMYSNDPK